jgi:hypothetical protein
VLSPFPRLYSRVYRVAPHCASPKTIEHSHFHKSEIIMLVGSSTLLRKTLTPTRWWAVFVSLLTLFSSPASSFVLASKGWHANGPLHATTIQDTPTVLPDFTDAADYLSYMESVAALPQGFATGTADGKFISVEAPSMGPLPIRGTIIHLTSGPTESWAAVYTKNKVR